MSNTTFPTTATPRPRSLAVHTRLPWAAVVTSGNAVERNAVMCIDARAYGFKQGRPPREVLR